jgi:serine/threonine protein kinase
LKPENILLNKYEIRIADFTTSKFIYDKETDDTRLGTQGFIPPELGSKGIPNVYKYGYDIYSVGIILFFLKFKDFPDISSLDNCFDNRECSNEFKDLFFLLTLSDYKKRIAIQNVLNDPWFLKNKETFFYLTKDNSNNKYNEINFRKISEKNI